MDLPGHLAKNAMQCYSRALPAGGGPTSVRIERRPVTLPVPLAVTAEDQKGSCPTGLVGTVRDAPGKGHASEMAGREPEGPFRSLARRARCFALAFALAACTVTWSAAALAWSDPDSEPRTRKRRAAALEAAWPCPRILAQSHRHGRAAVRPTQHIQCSYGC